MRRLLFSTIGPLLIAWPLNGQVDVPPTRYDVLRTGANLTETTLTAANVNVAEFGKLYTYKVDGAVYAQPQYVAGVVIDGIPRNVLYIATMNDKVYAFDADNPSAAPLWMRDFTRPPSVTPVPIRDITGDSGNMGNIGVQSTPVIDPDSGTIYLLARTKDRGEYVQRLHALDIRTGLSRSGSPVRITGSVPGTAPDSTAGAGGRAVTFDPKMQSQTAALAVTNGVVLVAWASHEDAASDHGWVMGYRTDSLARVGIFCVSPDAGGGKERGNSVLWNSPTAGPLVYNWQANDVLKAYRLSAGELEMPAYAQGGVLSPDASGGLLALSANADTYGTGIVWSSTPASQDGLRNAAGVLRAFDADTLREIWTSEQNAARDGAGTLMAFVPPIVVNGRVYLPRGDGAIAVYGLLPQVAPRVTATAGAAAVKPGASSTPAVGNAVTPRAGAVGIKFVGSNPTLMAAGESAGVIAQPNWNNASGGTRSTALALVDESGAPTTASVTWSSNGPWMTPIADGPGNARLMKGYLDTSSTSTTTVTLTGLAQGSYDVYVYADGDNRAYDRSAAYTISGPDVTTATLNLIDSANTNFATAFTGADNSNGNYVKFRITATGFTLSAAPILPATGTRRAPVNAVQIVPVTAAAPDFTIDASPASRTVTAGASTSYSATIGGLNGFNGTVALAVSGVPAGATATFTPASVSGSGNTSLNVTTSTSTPAGSSTLTMTATSGPLSHSTAVTLSVVAPPAGTGAIGINFLGSGTATIAPGESAGIIPKTHWNNAAGAASSTPLALVDDSGTPTNASVTWTAKGGWMTPIADEQGNMRLMKGYLDTSSTSVTTVTVSGLVSAAYDVYIYADGDNRAYTRTATYRISGPGITETAIDLTDPANTNFSGAFTQAVGSSGNYVKFSINAGGFTLTATPGTGTNTTLRAPVNAIQIVKASEAPPVSLDPPITIGGIGAGQGVEMRDGKIYLYGDGSTGVVREYDLVGTSGLSYTSRQIQLTVGGRDLVPHPTGLSIAPGMDTVLGNTVSEQGTILMIDWERALANGTLDGAVQATIADDLAANGTRPEYVRVGGRWLIATADYGAQRNEIRLYDPVRLKAAARTSEPGVLLHRFPSSPWVQTLHWLDEPGLLVLVQNQTSGAGWRLTVVDLARSIEAGEQIVTRTTDLAPANELEGFHVVAPGRGLFLTSTSQFNVYFASVSLF